MNDHTVFRCPQTRQRRAITVVELVVSVSACAVLAACLLPVLSEARRQGKAVHCRANLERLGAASAIHANIDTFENAIPVHPLMGQGQGALGEYEWGGRAGRGQPRTPGDPLASKWGTVEEREPHHRGNDAIPKPSSTEIGRSCTRLQLHRVCRVFDLRAGSLELGDLGAQAGEQLIE